MSRGLKSGDPALKVLGKEFLKLRKDSGLTQEALARRLTVERSYVSHIELGRMMPSADFWETADRVLGARGRLQELAEQARRQGESDQTALDIDIHMRGTLTGANQFGQASRERTTSILRQIGEEIRGNRLPYLEPRDQSQGLKTFIDRADQRVYVLKGAAGCGKTRFVAHSAQVLQDRVYLQLHSISAWDPPSFDLAEEILRYASMSAGGDALLTLERAADSLDQTCIVIIDGLSGQDDVNKVGMHLERILRQISTSRLKFLLVSRTPPDIEMSRFPVLAASVYEPSPNRAGTSATAVRWSLAEAAHAWSLSAEGARVSFSDLPTSLQQLATIPLYMRLIVDSGMLDSLNSATAYQLIDHCTRSIIRRSGTDSARTFQRLMLLAGTDSRDLVPDQLLDPTDTMTPAPDEALHESTLAPLLSSPRSDRTTFTHDVIREYFVATYIADLMIQHGRGRTIGAAFNELAESARRSAAARNVLEFTILALDSRAPDLLTAIASATTVSAETALPHLMFAASLGATFATTSVIRNAASRCSNGEYRELARMLLQLPIAAEALGELYPTWLLKIIRNYGSQMWPEVAQHLAQYPESSIAQRLLSAADLDRVDDAVFIAGHFELFSGDDPDRSRLLIDLRGHPDWRVRAALAETVGAEQDVELNTSHIAAHLVHDIDYKVRAAVARAIGSVAGALQRDYIRTLLHDENWHVRARLLDGILVNTHRDGVLPIVREAIGAHPSWVGSRPAHVAKLVERLLLLAGVSQGLGDDRIRVASLFVLLRELRSGFLSLPPHQKSWLKDQARASGDPLVLAEAEHLANDGSDRPPREMYRRMRGQQSTQVALDLHDLGHAVTVAETAAAAGVDLIEVGDPLIKSVGVHAVRAIKESVPGTRIVAEMMSADWGRDQVELAVEAGADIVLLIGPATRASVTAAVAASRRLGAPLVLDIPGSQLTHEWLRDMERAGVDGFTITTNIDLGVGSGRPIDTARIVRGWTQLPLSVSGGFGVGDHALANSNDWDISIIGRGISEAVDPAEAARHVIDTVRKYGTRKSIAGDPS